MNMFSSRVGSFITFMSDAIEIFVRERNSLALSSGRIPEPMSTAPITKNAPIMTNNGSKALRFFRNGYSDLSDLQAYMTISTNQ